MSSLSNTQAPKSEQPVHVVMLITGQNNVAVSTLLIVVNNVIQHCLGRKQFS